MSAIASATNSFFGYGLRVAAGLVASLSLLIGGFMTKYQPDYALDTAVQATLCCGIILVFISLINLGELIRFISHPVMSGFTTTAAAMLIGINLLKGISGLIYTNKSNGNKYHGNSVPPWRRPAKVPQTIKEVDYNWEVLNWFAKLTHQFTISDIIRPQVPMVSTCQSYQRSPSTSYSYGSYESVTSNDTYVEVQNTENNYRSYLYTDVQAVAPTAFPTITPSSIGDPTTKIHHIKNPYAVAIGWGTLIPLLFFLLIPKRIKG